MRLVIYLDGLMSKTRLISHLDGLMEVDSDHLPHAVLDHLRREEIHLPFLIHSDLPIVLLNRGKYC